MAPLSTSAFSGNTTVTTTPINLPSTATSVFTFLFKHVRSPTSTLLGFFAPIGSGIIQQVAFISLLSAAVLVLGFLWVVRVRESAGSCCRCWCREEEDGDGDGDGEEEDDCDVDLGHLGMGLGSEYAMIAAAQSDYSVRVPVYVYLDGTVYDEKRKFEDPGQGEKQTRCVVLDPTHRVGVMIPIPVIIRSEISDDDSEEMEMGMEYESGDSRSSWW